MTPDLSTVTLALGTRPEETDADRVTDVATRASVGDKRKGRVVVLDRDAGAGYVQDTATGACFGMSRDYQPLFDDLQVGMAVDFYGNRYNTVTRLSIP